MTVGTSSTLSATDLALDHELADIALGFRFLLDVSPVNSVSQRDAFLAGTAEAPEFEYRELEDDPDTIRARLRAVRTEAAGDHTVAHLLEAKRRELGLQLEMLAARGTDAFRELSIELYGTVAPALLAQAEGILANLDPGPGSADSWLDASEFASRAEAELDGYRALDPDLSVFVEVRADCSEIMVSNGVLLVPASARVRASRAEAIVQHEVGTHMLTFVNGTAQPLRLLGAGLAGYEETQEGLALLAEHLVAGLTAGRLRQVAARVVAVHLMLEGATFRAVHDSMLAAGFAPTSGFAISTRVFRSGGLTKDAVYLRGLSDLLGHLGGGGVLDVLWLGKMGLTSVPLVEALREQGAIGGAHLAPRYLAEAGPKQCLHELGSPTTVLDLVKG